jgi:hypothetical protein
MSSAPLRAPIALVLAYISGPFRVRWHCRSEAVDGRASLCDIMPPGRVLSASACISVFDGGEPFLRPDLRPPRTPPRRRAQRRGVRDYSLCRSSGGLDFAGSAASGPPCETVLSRATTRLHCTDRISERASGWRPFTKPAPVWELGRPREQPVYMGRHLSCFWCALADSLPKPNEPVPVSRPNLLGYRRKSVAK